MIKMLKSQAEEDAIINKVKVAGIHNLVNNQNSIHVIIMLVNKFHPTSTEFILEYIEANFRRLCKDKHGICLVKAA